MLYRDDWIVMVARERAARPDRLPDINQEARAVNLEVVTSLAEIYRERGEYLLLAMHYSDIGNRELRDKYIDLAIEQGVSDDVLVDLRSRQHRLDLVPREVIDRQIEKYEDASDWAQLGRFYRALGDHKAEAIVTCRSIPEDLESGNVFSAWTLAILEEADGARHVR